MRKEELTKMIRDEYVPDWEDSPSAEELARKLEDLHQLPLKSLEYYQTKTEIIQSVAKNCLEEFAAGKQHQGMISSKIFERLTSYLDSLEKTK